MKGEDASMVDYTLIRARRRTAAIQIQKDGQVVVRAEAGGKHSCYRADLGQRIDAAYFDQTNLPVPEELDEWGSWQLVGFNGDIYCLPPDNSRQFFP